MTEDDSCTLGPRNDREQRTLSRLPFACCCGTCCGTPADERSDERLQAVVATFCGRNAMTLLTTPEGETLVKQAS